MVVNMFFLFQFFQPKTIFREGCVKCKGSQLTQAELQQFRLSVPRSRNILFFVLKEKNIFWFLSFVLKNQNENLLLAVLQVCRGKRDV